MGAAYYYSRDGERAGPVSVGELRRLIDDGEVGREDLVWKEGMPDWTPAARVEGLLAPAAGPPPLPRSRALAPADLGPDVPRPDYRSFVGRKVAAGVCGILFGGFGVHKFIIGQPLFGSIMLAVWVVSFVAGFCLLVPFFICALLNLVGLIEGILYLTKSDDDFYQQYAVEKRPMF
ncbi:MAG: GYF domain-containing protein [Gemmataceae bacterium]|nr:GYF domain-containing protein [Gemmataceae bacterium]